MGFRVGRSFEQGKQVNEGEGTKAKYVSQNSEK